MSLRDKLTKLEEMHQAGALTDAQFDRARHRILADPADMDLASALGEEQPACPPTRMGEAVLVTLLCCLPIGIVAIWKAAKVRSIYDKQGYDVAQVASDDARNWVRYAVISGVVRPLAYALNLFLDGMLS